MLRACKAFAALIAIVAAISCASEQPGTGSSQASNVGEWAITSATPMPHAAATVAPLSARWKRIQVGSTTRDQVERRFGKGVEQPNGAVSYDVDRIATEVSYAGGTVASMRIATQKEISRDNVISAWGPPARERLLPASGVALDYDWSGLSIEFPDASVPASAIRLSAPTVADNRADAMQDALMPVRPAIAHPREAMADVAAVLQKTGGESDIADAGDQAEADEILAELLKRGAIIRGSDLTDYLQGLVDRLAFVVPEASYRWQVAVIKGADANAMNVGGGRIFITQGLLEMCDSEAQLSFVVSHEMAHQLKGHLHAIQNKARVATALVIAGAIAAGVFGGQGATQAVMQAGGAGAKAALSPFSREQEREADLIAMHILLDAGYDPRQAVATMERLKAEHDKYGESVAILSTHPSPELRMEDMQKWIGDRDAAGFSSLLVTTQEFEEIRSRYRLNKWE